MTWTEPPLEGLEDYAPDPDADARIPTTPRRAWAVHSGSPLGSCGVCCAVIVLDPEGANLEQHFAALHDLDTARRDIAISADLTALHDALRVAAQIASSGAP